MAGAKKAIPPPIDRPLSKAYLRQFTGWSTDAPPGLSDPTSCRMMENMQTARNGGIGVRPGLRYTSYLDTPDMSATTHGEAGVAYDKEFVGSFEPFYLNDGSRALLCAVREANNTVGFRVLLFSHPNKIVFNLTDPEIGFYIPQGVTTLAFSAETTYVTYLQIDNKILALSNAADSVRLFNVGAEKVAKRLNSITQPEWDDTHKVSVIHPDYQWIAKLAYTVRRNELLNPSFEAGTAHWSKGSMTQWAAVRQGAVVANQVALDVWTAPYRTNLVYSPLHNVGSTGIAGWHSGQGEPTLSPSGTWMKIFDAKGKNVFLAHGPKLTGLEPGKKYQLAFDFDLSSDAVLRARLQFYRNNGSEIGDPIKFFPNQRDGRWVSPKIEAPDNAVSVRVYLGADSTEKKQSWAKVKNVMLCRGDESTDIFSGSSGTGYYWTGTENASASLYWPNQDITIAATRVNVLPGQKVAGSIHVKSKNGVDKTVDVDTFVHDRNGTQVGHTRGTGSSGTGTWQRIGAVSPASTSIVTAGLQISIRDVAPNQVFSLDAGMLESNASAVDFYFDGSTVSDDGPEGPTQVVYSWENPQAPHMCSSIRTRTVDLTAIPLANSPVATSLLSSGDHTVNKYKMGFFYTFENELGESAPSKITEVRMMRPQSNWLWETAGTHSEPSGTPTSVADLCADQLAVVVPETVYNRAIAAGALKWNLYTFSWSDQDPVPVEAQWAGSMELFADKAARMSNTALPYLKGGWINITPSRKFTLDAMPLPTKDNRVDYSKPPRARNGLVAGDRIVLVGDADEPGAVRWTSNRPGEFTKFTASKGGGVKTLSAGNLHIPGAVVLWQNPQSVDTLTILCIGSDGTSICYYMSPADINAQASSSSVMGFEETTNTPGSMTPHGALVHNNALFRPIDRALLKSTAQNYNINHKTLSDDIANMWEGLQKKQDIKSAVHDNRLHFIVNNPRGEPVEDGCCGNEIWVYDMGAGTDGTWSRYLIHASALRVLEYGARVYLGVVRPDGVYYLDPDAREDDYVLNDGTVGQRPIPWFFEMNTQGANRAHDAWAHLQQVSVMFGNYAGAARYGIRGRTIHGQIIEMEKRFQDDTVEAAFGPTWDVEDHLLVRRDLKEWYFFAGSVDGETGSGLINLVQYRYTPTTVNVGYEYGSIETFEYARNTLSGEDTYSSNGIPRPGQDLEWERT